MGSIVYGNQRRVCSRGSVLWGVGWDIRSAYDMRRQAKEMLNLSEGTS